MLPGFQRLVRIDSVAAFDAIVAGVRAAGPPHGWQEWLSQESPIRVPSGPVEYW